MIEFRRLLLAAALLWTPVAALRGQAISGSIDGKSVVSATPAHLRSVVASPAGVVAPRWIQTQAQPASPAGRVGSRVLLGVVGSVAGLFVGGLAGFDLLPRRDCDDPGLCEIVVGVMIGSVLGAAIGTAAPDGPAGCTFGRRFALSLLGAAVGGAAGWLTGGGDNITLIAVPIGAIIGGVAGAERCRR